MEFELEGDKYIISFKCPRNIYFIYDVNLKLGKADISIRRKISQDKIEYIQKLKHFKEALE